MADELLPSDPEWVGPYRLIRRLGTGGMGQVYLARSPGSRLVAVKVIRPELSADPAFRSRFEREVKAARSVSGMFTAPVVDADAAGQPPWLATAYVPGPSLAEAVAERGPLPAGVVLTLAAGLAEALVAIHQAGIVHRDLKPANVLLAGDGPRVIDFGISRAVDASVLTQAGTVMGSPGYLAPEQVEGRPVGPPGDVFSLGAVLAFAAAGEGPFGIGSAAALAFRVVNAAPNLDGVPAQLRPMIERCLAKDPAARPTPTELLTSLAAGNVEPSWLSQPMAAGAEPGGSLPRSSRPVGGTRPFPGPAGPTGPAGPVAGWPAPSGRPVRRGRPARRGLGVIAGAAAILAAVVAVIALVVSGQGPGTAHTSARPPASLDNTPAAASRSAAPRTTPSISPSSSPPAKPEVDGVWTGSYDCNQGLTGMQLTITGSTGGALTAVMRFYPIAANPGVADGSYELVGSYSASGGLVLKPDYWINEPANYEMIGLTAPRPQASSMSGSVHGDGCSTFSVSR
jgi:predicted Ser/Thr protein kinase